VTADARAKTPRGLTRDVRADWLLLASPTQELKVFDPSSLAQLPEPARRWLCHAIVPGTPLARTAEIWMHGPIRLGDWRPFYSSAATDTQGRFRVGGYGAAAGIAGCGL
jgi:hypothetical protein